MCGSFLCIHHVKNTHCQRMSKEDICIYMYMHTLMYAVHTPHSVFSIQFISHTYKMLFLIIV